MPGTPRGYKRLKNGLLKKSTTKRKTTRRKQKGKGVFKKAKQQFNKLKSAGKATSLSQVNSALKKVNDAKKHFSKATVDAAVKELKKGSGKVAKLLKGSGLRRAGAGLKGAGVR